MKVTQFFDRRKPENAQGMVEFALILPILMLIVLGLIETGRLIFIYSSVTNAAREAARYGSATGNNDAGVPRFRDCQGIIDAAVNVGFLGSVQAGNVVITYDNGPGTAAIGNCPPSDVLIQTGTRIQVEVISPFDTVIPGLLPFEDLEVRAVSARTIIRSVSINITQPAPGPTNTPLPTRTLTPSITNTPTITQTPSRTPTPTRTPTITLTPIFSYTPSRTPTNTATITNTPTFTPTFTPTLTPTVTNTVACTTQGSNQAPTRVGNNFNWSFSLLAGSAQEISSITIAFNASNASTKLQAINLNGNNIYFSSNGPTRGTVTITFNPTQKLSNFDGSSNGLTFTFNDGTRITGISLIEVNFVNPLCAPAQYTAP